MAWLGGGSTPGRGPYGEQIGKVSEYLLDHCEQSGFISVEGAQSHGPMYEHGFATLFLAEVYGMSEREDLREKLSKAVELIVRTQNAEGGFRYMRQGPGSSEFPRSAAGVVALYNAGIYKGREVERGLAYLDQFLPRGGGQGQLQDGHFFYGHYYAVQAMWQADGERWKRWYPAIRDLLVSRQQADGSWVDPVGSEYGTAMAAIILQMPDNSVPIFQ